MRSYFAKRQRRWHAVRSRQAPQRLRRSYFAKRQRRWHEPHDDASNTEWLALVFAVGCLVVLWVVGHWWSEGF